MPEVVFQPGIAGVDQAGITEIAEDILMGRLPSHSARGSILNEVFLTGGYCLFHGFEERLENELRAVLLVEAQPQLKVRSA